ncbi:MAG TPA: MarR family winged helix-turn-helix transcriptional regulator [Solirubrobacteraceae bacterium]|nr:MarR family winged helix-turn-helix transcriptional regulator [Solirubrobacteraceae bacterium]
MPERTPRKQTAEQAGYLVADVVEAAGAIRRLGDEMAATVGQTQARWSALSVFASEGDWTVARGARRLGISRQSLQRVVDLLLDEGLLAAVPNPDHARSPLIRLTPEGERTLATIAAASEPWQARLAERMTLDEVLAARKVLAAVVQAAREGVEQDG